MVSQPQAVLFAVVAVLASAAPRSAFSQPVVPAASPALANVGTTTSVGVAVPADLVVYRVVGNLLIGATAQGKLVAYDVSAPRTPQKRSERDLGAPVVELRVHDGVVFAVVAEQKVEAFTVGDGGQIITWRPQPVAVGSTLATADSAPTASGKAVRVMLGKVLTLQRGSVLVELDQSGTVKPGDLLLVRSQAKSMRLNLFTGKEEEIVSNAPVATVEVRQVEGLQAIAELNRGDVAGVGDTVELSMKEWVRTPLIAPRAGYDQYARVMLRPLFNFGEIDVGSVTELAWGHYWDWLHIDMRLAPLGISVPHSVNLANFQVLAGYDADTAEFGVGTGWLRSVYGAQTWECDGTTDSGADEAAPTPGTVLQPRLVRCERGGPTILQFLRLGTADGLNLRLTNTIVVNGGKFRFGAIDGSIDMPIGRSINLFTAAGGSPSHSFGEFGTRTYLHGVGARETLILTTAIGGSRMVTLERFGGGVSTVGTFNSVSDQEQAVGGLHIAIGLEYRM
ncbi:MAG: hypothetical protein EXR79_01025 [Myxococcales bacterium]|nr:hypothetical protein [Myxococcales bacterium]